MNIFFGLLDAHDFFFHLVLICTSKNSLLYFAPPPPEKFSNCPSLNGNLVQLLKENINFNRYYLILIVVFWKLSY